MICATRWKLISAKVIGEAAQMYSLPCLPNLKTKRNRHSCQIEFKRSRHKRYYEVNLGNHDK